MRYCFDLDDTISVHRNRDYVNAMPINSVIERMREIKRIDPNAYIIINTARGMNSCKGDARLAEQRNRPIIEKWMYEHEVPYDEIIFGKPLADVYIDDKAVSTHHFAAKGISKYCGFSGAEVYRVGDMIVKYNERAQHEYDWYKANKSLNFSSHHTPDVFSITLGGLYLEYIEGDVLSDLYIKATEEKQREYTLRAADILREFSTHGLTGENNVRGYADHIESRARSIGVDVSKICRDIVRQENLLRPTYFHGDFTALNIIVKNRDYYLIDPNLQPISTWLVDAAKFRASINGLDAAITHRENRTSHLTSLWDELFPAEAETIRLIEKTHYVRVMYYARKLNDQRAFDELNKLLKE